jgi:hypothetical protein|tara:strand:- start:288 stop:446 length:159 start_codon:yes stop_codon:yes gene_type:complete
MQLIGVSCLVANSNFRPSHLVLAESDVDQQDIYEFAWLSTGEMAVAALFSRP